VWPAAAIALLPAAIVLLLTASLFKAAPWAFLPVWTDEVAYWNEAAVFTHAGFDGGYITVHEQTPSASFSRFGAHGPSFAVFQGAIGRIIGWQPFTPFLINLAVVSLAAFAWLRATGAAHSVAAALLVATYWPLLLYLPTGMQEATHFALAFLFAVAIERVSTGTRSSTWIWPAILVAVSALLRPTWALMLLPLGWNRARRGGPVAIAGLVAATIVLAVAAYGSFDLLASAGYQNNLRRVAEAWTDSPENAVAMTVNRAALNGRLLFTTTEDEPPEIAFRYFLVSFVVILLARWFMMRRGWSGPRPAAVLELALLAVIPVFAVVLVFGEVESWRDFRILAPHLLVALLLLAVRGGWERWLWMATLAVAPIYVSEFVEFHEERFTASHAPISAMGEATRPVLPFRRDASPWANTVLVHAESLQYPLVGLPAGIGVSYVADWANLPDSVQSHYLLLRPADREEIGARLPLTPLADTPLGVLYLNEAARRSGVQR
jgi:hypothetical protein